MLVAKRKWNIKWRSRAAAVLLLVVVSSGTGCNNVQYDDMDDRGWLMEQYEKGYITWEEYEQMLKESEGF